MRDHAAEDAAIEKQLDEEFEQLRRRREGPEFDCQSVISTYSNLENRPKLIAVPKKGLLGIEIKFMKCTRHHHLS